MIVEENENKTKIFTQEIDKLNSILKRKSSEIDDSRIKNSKLEFSIHEKLSFESELLRLKNMLEFKNLEIEEWRKKHNSLEITIVELRSSQGKLFEYENKISILSIEIERLNSLIKIRTEEAEEFKIKFYEKNSRVLFFLNN